MQNRPALRNSWTLWYLDNMKSRRWEDCITEVGSFSTMEDFVRLMTHITPVSKLKPGCDYSLFKTGVNPMWEDEANEDGGRWIVRVDESDWRQTLDYFWSVLITNMIEGYFGVLSPNINGVTASVRGSRSKVGLWTTDLKRHQGSIIQIGMKIKTALRLPHTKVIKFYSHVKRPIKSYIPPLYYL